MNTETTNKNTTEYLHTVSAGVLVPLLQCVVTGAIVFIIAAMAAHKYALNDWYFWAAMCAGFVMLGQWLFSQAIWRRLITMVERQLRVDLNNDGQIGEELPVMQEPVVKTLRVELKQNNGGGFEQVNYYDLPFGDRLPELARGLTTGRALTHANWVGIARGKLFTPAEFISLRDAMLKHEFIRPNNPHDQTRGFGLTRLGAQVMLELADHSPTAGRCQNVRHRVRMTNNEEGEG